MHERDIRNQLRKNVKLIIIVSNITLYIQFLEPISAPNVSFRDVSLKMLQTSDISVVVSS